MLLFIIATYAKIKSINMSEEPPTDNPQPPLEHDEAWGRLSPGQRDLLINTEGMLPDGTPIIPTELPAEPNNPPDDFELDQAMAWRYGKEAAMRIIEKDSAVKAEQEHHETKKRLAEKEKKLAAVVDENNHNSQTIFDLGELTSKQERKIEQLTPLASKAGVDGLTKLKNRDGMEDAYEALVKDHIRHSKRRPFDTSILYIDLDNFKQVNDRFGHTTGDKLIRFVAQRFKARLRREADEVGRIGGDEFLVLLPDTDTEGARDLADALCNIVRFGAGKIDGKETEIGVSIGIAPLDDTKTFEEMIEYADSAMYAAKKAGGNKVVVFNGDDTSSS